MAGFPSDLYCVDRGVGEGGGERGHGDQRFCMWRGKVESSVVRILFVWRRVVGGVVGRAGWWQGPGGRRGRVVGGAGWWEGPGGGRGRVVGGAGLWEGWWKREG